MLPVILLACTPATIGIGSVGNPDAPGGGGGATGDGVTSEPHVLTDPDDQPEDVPGVDPEPEDASESDWVFSLDVVHTVELTLTDENWAALQAAPLDHVEAEATYDGEPMGTIGVRVKGKYGSYRDLNGKAAFKLDFNRFVDGQRFYGLEQVVLNNMVADYTKMHEVVGFAAHEKAGNVSSRVGYAWVTLNGIEYGLYTIIEPIDDRWLARHYGDASGTVYEGEYRIYNGGSSYELVDFTASSADLFEHEEGEDDKRDRIDEIVTLVEDYAYTDEFYARLSTQVDWDQILRLWAAEVWMAQWDGYFYNTNNYYIHFNPTSGLMEILPWDLDYALYYSDTSSWDRDFQGVLADGCYWDPACRASLMMHLAEVADLLDDDEMANLATAVQPVIEDAIFADTRREDTDRTVREYQASFPAMLSGRSANMRSGWGL